MHFHFRFIMSLEKETINADRETIALEDQDSPEKVKERVEQILTNWPFVCHNFY